MVIQIIGAILLILYIPFLFVGFIFRRCLKRRAGPNGKERWKCRKAIWTCKFWTTTPRPFKSHTKIHGASDVNTDSQR